MKILGYVGMFFVMLAAAACSKAGVRDEEATANVVAALAATRPATVTVETIPAPLVLSATTTQTRASERSKTTPSFMPTASFTPTWFTTNTPRSTDDFPEVPPMVTAAPLPEDGQLYKDLLAQGYKLSQAASFSHSDGFVYSAYKFINWDLVDYDKKEATVLAFYRWDGEQNILLGSQYPSPYSDGIESYPGKYASFANWDDPYGSMAGLGIVEDPDNQTRARRRLDGFASDINGNGRPEFAFAAEYCPISCSRPLYAIDFFEIAAGGKVINLSRGMPGRLSLYSVSEEPLVFEVNDSYWHGFMSQISIPYFYEWDGTEFVEITERMYPVILATIAEKISSIQSYYGEAYPSGESNEADVISVLLLYEHIGKSKNGLEAFLNITNPKNWEQSPLTNRCLLEIIRARAQEDYNKHKKFSIPLGIQYFDPSFDLPREIEGLDANLYDLSSCQQWMGKD